jgi:hypothetical protein
MLTGPYSQTHNRPPTLQSRQRRLHILNILKDSRADSGQAWVSQRRTSASTADEGDRRADERAIAQPRGFEGRRTICAVCAKDCEVYCGGYVANWLIQHDTGRHRKLGKTRLTLAYDFRTRVLRSRDDAPLDTSIRPRQTRHYIPCITSTVGRHDRGRHSHKQNGSRVTAGL